ncbi:MAG: hypothetical protein OSA81_03425 [Longimicrobiales bacterium]|nr:hypothetical protein [Longimicrobiales bacterium]
MFSIVNPFPAPPGFVGPTDSGPMKEQRGMITQTSVAVLVILMMSYLTGQSLLRFFSVSVASLRVASGLVIFAMAWVMLQARISATKQIPEEIEEAEESSDATSDGDSPAGNAPASGPRLDHSSSSRPDR